MASTTTSSIVATILVAMALVPDSAAAAATATDALAPAGIGSVAASLAMIVLAIVALGFGARYFRRGPVGSGGTIELVASRSLGTRERIVVVRIGDEHLVVGVTPSSMQTLHVTAAAVREPGSDAPASGFAQRLRGALNEAAS